MHSENNFSASVDIQLLSCLIISDSPMPLRINGDGQGKVYLSSSPPPLCTHGRTTDIDSILDVIHKAKKFIHISVMDYSPTFLYSWPEK